MGSVSDRNPPQPCYARPLLPRGDFLQEMRIKVIDSSRMHSQKFPSWEGWPVGSGWVRRSVLKWITLAIMGMVLTGAIAQLRKISTTFARYPQPQAILILDGGKNRVPKAALFAQEHPRLPILISGNCSHRPAVKTTFATARLSHRVHYDLRATDTLTNFTTLVDDFSELGIHHVYLVTSTAHMGRARAIATLVFGSRGIVVTPVALPEIGEVAESELKSVRDRLRALLWLTTRKTGSEFNAQLNHFPGGMSCLFQFRKKQAEG